MPTSAPTSLSMVANSGTYIEISWTPPSDLSISDFMIYYRVNGSSQLPMNVSTGSYLTSFTLTELESSTVYEITIAAGNSIGFGPESTPIFPETGIFSKKKMKKYNLPPSLPLSFFLTQSLFSEFF